MAFYDDGCPDCRTQNLRGLGAIDVAALVAQPYVQQFLNNPIVTYYTPTGYKYATHADFWAKVKAGEIYYDLVQGPLESNHTTKVPPSSSMKYYFTGPVLNLDLLDPTASWLGTRRAIAEFSKFGGQIIGSQLPPVLLQPAAQASAPPVQTEPVVQPTAPATAPKFTPPTVAPVTQPTPPNVYTVGPSAGPSASSPDMHPTETATGTEAKKALPWGWIIAGLSVLLLR